VLHQTRQAHRDIAPKNIFLDGDFDKELVAKLGDFGLSVDVNATKLTMMSVKGTPMFMSPELQTTGQGGMPSDMWAVGVTFFQVLSGSVVSPFSTYEALLRGEPSKLPVYVPEYLSAVVKGLLRKDPISRLTWEQALKALD